MFVDRDALGNVRDIYALRQHAEQEELLPDNHADIEAFLAGLAAQAATEPATARGYGRNPRIAADGCPAAKGDNATDDYPALQAHADWLRWNGEGWLDIPAGHYRVSQPVIIRGNVSVRGEKFASVIRASGANGVLLFDASGTHCLRDIALYGDMSTNPTTPTLEVMAGSETFIDGIRCWYGAPAFRNRGDDGTTSNSFFWSRTCLIENYGTHWWKRVKIDHGVTGVPLIPYAFLAGNPSAENYFEQCDFTGDFGHSLMAAGCTGAFFKFTDCIFSSPVDVSNIGWAKFSGCTFSSTIAAGSTPITITDSYAFTPVTVSGSNKRLANNINIT